MARTLNLIPSAIIFLVSFITLIGCTSDYETELSSAASHTQQGWQHYRLGDYTQALISFERAINTDPEYADAHNGVGWSHLSLSLSIPLIQEAFQNAIRYDSSNTDAWVGLANVLYLRNKDSSDFNAAIRAIDNALQSDGQEYLYRHDYQSEADLFAMKAACYFYLGEIQKAKQEIDKALVIDEQNRTVNVLQNLLKE
ncbi:MAG: tetratricopeptide repeat protein [Candidatus Poribacteria bacterium]|nr:tetratricopeptide repeat protein [Candidatus Poribacteria bacterium]